MNLPSIKVVIHTEYGGFSLDDEMAAWLVKNKGWTISAEYGEDVHLWDCGHGSVRAGKRLSGDDDMALRTHPDMVECVGALQLPRGKMPHHDKRQVDRLTIMDVHVSIGVEDYHDGKERVNGYVDAQPVPRLPARLIGHPLPH